ncbi:hypothetical protein FNO01nite_13930 [Flavobacterium noncentrifugens]|uniref:hypothetical protein n=1 Tax=Flavobacterium noncentrifugens TaxID=1128970 RepID=UPI0011143A35|nr:hypothetical protein [Flavobacterium noncentrifugens]GEP50721.1 hypothetical protein FNO01nite_13930 [Flavobacterium noncentrifugens]
MAEIADSSHPKRTIKGDISSVESIRTAVEQIKAPEIKFDCLVVANSPGVNSSSYNRFLLDYLS